MSTRVHLNDWCGLHDFAGWRPLGSFKGLWFAVVLSHSSPICLNTLGVLGCMVLLCISHLSLTCLPLVYQLSPISLSLSLSVPVSLWVRCFESPTSPVCFRCRILFSVCLPCVLVSQFLGSGRIVSGQRRLGTRWVCSVCNPALRSQRCLRGVL